MTPEAQRIAIAEACGFTEARTTGIGHTIGTDVHGNGCITLPDYLNDLNAMHEAEKVLNAAHRRDYVLGLATHGAFDTYSVCFATDSQRAQAFLWALGLWK